MRKMWTDEMVRGETLKISESLGGVMPTHSYLRSIGRMDLSNQICKRYSFNTLAELLCLKRASSDSDTGWDGEIRLSEILQNMGFEVERMVSIKSPYDLLVCGVIRVDVKSAKKAVYGRASGELVGGWFYRIGKHVQSDVVALFQIDTEDVYMIPWHACTSSNMTISVDGGKYAGYKNNFDALRKLCETANTNKHILLNKTHGTTS